MHHKIYLYEIENTCESYSPLKFFFFLEKERILICF
ncbi:hypothetical protein AB751O23_AD_00310 [Chlamydiales bacterium SCGC AB-751-O23]|nr:hypothetical protein AB751O23_AD_00310 [Chlamydiales bacterium SCGC AB-751-O23]